MSLTERFWSKVHKTETCWLWVAFKMKSGYGKFYSGGDRTRAKTLLAHRAAYEFAKGSIPVGMDLDHTCRVRHCVNPDHLEPVTRKENLRRGINWKRELTHCKRGHELSEENTYLYGGNRRDCRTCRSERGRARRRRDKRKANGL